MQTNKNRGMTKAEDMIAPKTYVGLKVITASIAEPCGCIDAEGCSRCGQEGYDVIYPDGYKSWSPKDTFEKAYKSDGHFNFSHALELAKQGESFRLPQWEPDVRILVQKPTDLSKMTAPYLYLESRFGKVPWIPTKIEMFAENYELYKEPTIEQDSMGNFYHSNYVRTGNINIDKQFWHDVHYAVEDTTVAYTHFKDANGEIHDLKDLIKCEGYKHAN